MFDESYVECWLRWHLYRKRKRRPSGRRRAEYEFHRTVRALPPGGLMVDCGANVGDVTGCALRYGMSVVAFEPDPTAFGVLQERFAGNGKVRLIRAAVGAEARTAEIFQMPEVAAGAVKYTQGSSLIQRDLHTATPVDTVEVVDLVAFLRGLGEPVTLLKMDIEGAEAECLEALLDAGIHRDIPAIMVETHEIFSPELAERLGAIRRRISAEGATNINLDWG